MIKQHTKERNDNRSNLVQIENMMTNVATTSTVPCPKVSQAPHPRIMLEQRPEIRQVQYNESNLTIFPQIKLLPHPENQLVPQPDIKLTIHRESRQQQPDMKLVPQPDIKLITHPESRKQRQTDMKLISQPETNSASKQSGSKKRKLVLNPEVKQMPCHMVNQKSLPEVSRITHSENKQIPHSENENVPHPKTIHTPSPVSHSGNNFEPLPKEGVAPSARTYQVPTCEIKQSNPDKKRASPYIGIETKSGAEVKQNPPQDNEKLLSGGIRQIRFADCKTPPRPVLFVSYDKGKQVTCRATQPEIEQKLLIQTQQMLSPDQSPVQDPLKLMSKATVSPGNDLCSNQVNMLYR